jgi:hypothetical protein
MALIPKVEPKQEKKVVSARLDEEITHCFNAMRLSSGALRTSTSSANR